jgi:ubiquinone biosynthesis protein
MRYIAEIPGIAFEVSEMVRDGKIRIGVEHKGLTPLIEAKNKARQSLAKSIISAAIFLSSAIIIAAQIPPFWHGISVIGLSGIALAGIFTVLALKK